MIPSPGDLRGFPAPPRGRTGWPWTEVPASPSAPASVDLPVITVITPSFNQAVFLEATLRSVLLQRYPRLEYWVMDGGSTDGSVEIIQRYSPWLSGWRSERDRGQGHAINEGFARATGSVVAWLNSDDRYLPGTLLDVARQVAAHPTAVAWIGACRSVDVRGREVHLNVPHGLELPSLADWMGSAWFAQPASFYDADAARRAGPMDEELQSSFDLDFFLRLARLGRLVGSATVWAEETRHPDAKTTANPGRSHAEMHLVQIRNGYESIALAQMTRELQEWSVLRRTTCWDRWKALVARALRGPRAGPSP
jgi:glycosyltransferase involved in cell wall biosynthesis